MHNKVPGKYLNGYSISILLHAALLLLGALYVIKPHLAFRWHQFEWELPTPGLIAENPASQGLPQLSSDNQMNTDVTEAQAATSPEPASDSDITPRRIIESPLDKPAATSQATTDRPGINRRLGSSALRDLGTNAPGGNMGFSSSMEPGSGDAFVIDQLKPQIVPTQDGEVLLEFRLSPRGFVVINSVNIISYSSSAYVEAVRKVLPEWRFGFHRAYKADKLYRVRCKFIINE